MYDCSKIVLDVRSTFEYTRNYSSPSSASNYWIFSLRCQKVVSAPIFHKEVAPLLVTRMPLYWSTIRSGRRTNPVVVVLRSCKFDRIIMPTVGRRIPPSVPPASSLANQSSSHEHSLDHHLPGAAAHCLAYTTEHCSELRSDR